MGVNQIPRGEFFKEKSPISRKERKMGETAAAAVDDDHDSLYISNAFYHKKTSTISEMKYPICYHFEVTTLN